MGASSPCGFEAAFGVAFGAALGAAVAFGTEDAGGEVFEVCCGAVVDGV